MPHERKPQNEDWESFADRKIREAQEDGAFERLPGFGKPIPGLDQPAKDDWWLKQKLKEERLSVMPPVLEARLKVEKTLDEIQAIDSETEVRKRLRELNEIIRQAMYSPIPGPPDGIALIDIEQTIADWKSRRKQSTS